MPTSLPFKVLVDVTSIPVPTFIWANVPVPRSITFSLLTIPLNVPVIVAIFVPS